MDPVKEERKRQLLEQRMNGTPISSVALPLHPTVSSSSAVPAPVAGHTAGMATITGAGPQNSAPPSANINESRVLNPSPSGIEAPLVARSAAVSTPPVIDISEESQMDKANEQDGIEAQMLLQCNEHIFPPATDAWMAQSSSTQSEASTPSVKVRIRLGTPLLTSVGGGELRSIIEQASLSRTVLCRMRKCHESATCRLTMRSMMLEMSLGLQVSVKCAGMRVTRTCCPYTHRSQQRRKYRKKCTAPHHTGFFSTSIKLTFDARGRQWTTEPTPATIFPQ
jgi:hypothetical protein